MILVIFLISAYRYDSRASSPLPLDAGDASEVLSAVVARVLVADVVTGVLVDASVRGSVLEDEVVPVMLTVRGFVARPAAFAVHGMAVILAAFGVVVLAAVSLRSRKVLL